MLSITIPDILSGRINVFAELSGKTPEEFILEILEEVLKDGTGIRYKKDDFLSAFMKFRQDMERENIQITDSDFEMLRDNSAGREMSWL